MYPWNLISFEYIHSMTIRIKARRIKITPNTIDQIPGSKADTIEVAKVKIANANNMTIATTNAMIGEYRGKQ